MVNLELSDEQLMLREMARDFANEEIKPNAASWDRDSIFPREAISKANELGLLTLKIPEKYGGGGMGSWVRRSYACHRGVRPVRGGCQEG